MTKAPTNKPPQKIKTVGKKVKTPKILCLPSAGNNPYQSLLYCEASKTAEIDYAGPGGLSNLNADDYESVHLHWDDRIFGRGETAEDNQELLRESVDILTAFKANGGRIIWTIHNRVPHKARDLETFEEGRRQLSKLADVIHVHADHAADYMINTYGTARDKIAVIPHPSYLGSYEPDKTTLNRELAQSEAAQFLFFGMFRGDKGVHEIREVAGKLTKRGYDYKLRMYGKAFGSQARLIRLLEANPNIDLRTDRIPDEEVPEIFGTSHVFLAPYRSLFTSGSVMLALTFGLPIIGPNVRELRETTPEECHELLYDPDSPRGLIRSMIAFTALNHTEIQTYRKACLDFAKARAPEIIGKDISKALNLNK